MNEIKIKQRIENAIDAFFDNEILTENNSLTFCGESELLKKQISESFIEKADILVKFLKQVFLFLPGVLLLFGLSSLVTFIPLMNQYNTIRLNKPLSFLITYIVSVLLVWFGIGDLKKPKHLIVPGTIAATGFTAGLIAAFVTIGFGLFPLSSDTLRYSIYFLPLAFIAAFLAKGWVDGMEIKQ